MDADLRETVEVSPGQRVSSPQCAGNIRFASWLTFVVFNLLWLVLLVGVLTDPATADKASVRYGFAGFWLVFGLACLYVTIRGIRVAVWIDGDDVRVRNYLRSYSVRTDNAVAFSFGYPQARMPMYEQAGSLQLASGEVRPVAAISRGMLGSRSPSASVNALVENLNLTLSSSRLESD